MAFQELSKPHVDSFNFAAIDGLRRIVKYIRPIEFDLNEQTRINISVDYIDIGKPRNVDGTSQYPADCRRLGLSYTGQVQLRLRLVVNGIIVGVVNRPIGQTPIMLRSRMCNLYNLNDKQLVQRHEEADEMGGYFVISGRERLIRMLIMPRRNYPIACVRPSFKKRGTGYSENAIIVRAVRDDETSAVIILHWRTTGEPILSFTYEKEQFFVPISIILRALVNKTELEMFEEIVRGNEDSLSLEQSVMVILSRLKSDNFSSRSRALKFIGVHFRARLKLPPWYTDEEVACVLFDKCIAIHLDKDIDKFFLLCLMIRKLHSLATGQCCVESNDSLMFQEILLPGHMYLQILKDRIENWLTFLRFHIETKAIKSTRIKSMGNNLTTDFLSESMSATRDITSAMSFYMSTGNLRSDCYIGVSQTSGLTVPADNINMCRFAAHFRAVHRGAFFAKMRTTTVRKLLPECWGFICPVHTPDGTPCGLLNHLSAVCRVVSASPSEENMARLSSLITDRGNLIPVERPRKLDPVDLNSALPVLLNGRLLGWVEEDRARPLCDWLRSLKRNEFCKDVPITLEIGLIPRTEFASPYSGVFLFSGAARLLRPVRSLANTSDEDKEKQEWVGTFEQPYMDIAVSKTNGYRPGITTHMEISPQSIFSFNASLIPFPDYNQSPRNMYQCQMGKQTMGNSYSTWRYRSDNKLYHLVTPQKPLVRTEAYDKYKIDNHPLGFNAVVAVMAYTGYDMEDAMVINKASYERGFAAACIFKSEVIKLGSVRSMKNAESLYAFGSGGLKVEGLDEDGFPPIGTRLYEGSPLYIYVHLETRVTTLRSYKSNMIAYVEAISLNGTRTQATMTLRLPRNPDIGDKYSSRHGQKGVNSLLVAPEDLPWTQDGTVPDLIFNPHGFPTRMTMGMMIEFLAGKSAAITGKTVNCTAFQRAENDPPYHDYAKILQDSGFNYWCTERMICGSTGREIEADIFMGVVYYQRLRHMVADKFQVRSQGRVDRLTRQPVKGRKIGGGIRLGEMERDCLLSHGTLAILQDRLVDSNPDRVVVTVCNKCGGLMHTDFVDASGVANPEILLGADRRQRYHQRWKCQFCDTSDSSQDHNNSVRRVAIPHVLRYLVQELASMKIRVRFKVDDII